MLPADPSQVFFGEICGANGCFPMALPTKYAVESAAQVITNANSRSFGPSFGRPCSRGAYDNGKATRRSALDDIPAPGRVSTRGRRVHRIKTVTPRTNRKNTVTGEYSTEIRLMSELWYGLSPRTWTDT